MALSTCRGDGFCRSYLLFDAWVKERAPQPASQVPVAGQQSEVPQALPAMQDSQKAAPGISPSPALKATNLAPVLVSTDVLMAEIDPVGGGLSRITSAHDKTTT
jgi:hypothetical protein